jgi:hypothetical protein
MADLLFAAMTGETSRLWLRLEQRHKDDLKLAFHYIAKYDGNKILFVPGLLFEEDVAEIRLFERRILRVLRKEYPRENIRSITANYVSSKSSLSDYVYRVADYSGKFKALTFGADSAEQDKELLDYFLETPAYARVMTYQKGIVIGPKGSGKSSILRALSAYNQTGHTIEITPEVFATSMLKTIVESGQGLEEERAFVATWEFSILFEVFKQLSLDPKSLPKLAQMEVVAFLKRHSDFETDDLFSRFIRYLQRIQNVKLAGMEITAKTKELQTLFALEPVYNLVLKIRKYMRKKILILIDELDQGWDNSDHSNRFLAGLLQAAVQIQNLGIQAHVVVFVRSEIFDLVRTKLAQLDKIRSSIERLKWSDGELMNLIFKRISHHFGYNKYNEYGTAASLGDYEAKDVLGVIFEPTDGIPGFDYLLSRTTRRPREVLQFTRLAHQNAVDQRRQAISSEAIRKAEEEFSVWKLEHICSEYLHIYPDLEALLRTFRGKQKRFARADLEVAVFEFQESIGKNGEWAKREIADVLHVLYQIEFIGAKRLGKSRGIITEFDEFEFFYEASAPNLNSIDEFLIHPAFWKSLELLG